MKIEGTKKVRSRTEKVFVLDRKQVIEILCEALGLEFELTEYKAQGLKEIELKEVVDGDGEYPESVFTSIRDD